VSQREDVFGSHEYWRLFTGILVHADLNHFFSNAIGLFLFGYLLYGYFGPLVYPVLAFLLGTIVQAISLASYPPATSLVGASGVVYLMAASWLTLFVLIERRFSILKRLLRSIGFALVMLLSSTFDPAISYRTHFIGLFAGVLLALIYFFFSSEKIRAAEILEEES
jgi:rhomboid protease GluP